MKRKIVTNIVAAFLLFGMFDIPTSLKAEDVSEDAIAQENEIKYPGFSETVVVDNTKIGVVAPEGAFPEGVSLSVQKVETKAVSSAVEEIRNDEANVVSSYTFDIKVLDKEGNEVQPKDDSKVEVTFELAEANNLNLDTQVYHISDDDLAIEELAVSTEGSTITVETDGFSFYTVEFTYNNFQYVLEGDTSISLNTILETLQLSGEVKDVEVSNDELFSAIKENDEWIIKANKAFTSTEWMKVNIEDVIYEIVVTDTIPGNNVTNSLDMDNGETKTGNFTITGGPVRSPNPGSATIKDGTITNNASNSAKGGYSSSKGSALISRTNNGYTLENLTMNSTENNLVLNIWANASINAKNVVLNGSSNANNDVPFLMVGGYPQGGAGRLNFSGDNTISNAKGSIIGGNNNSSINVNDGTLTIKDSDIKVKDGIKINVKSGATLVFDNSTFSQNTPTIVLEDGATLIVKNGSNFSTVPNAGAFNVGSGTTVEVDNATFNLGVNAGMNIANGGTLKLKNSATLNMTGNEGNGINSNGDIVIEDSTVNGNGKKTVITSKGTLNVTGANTNSHLNNVVINHQTDANISQTDLDNCMIKTGAGTTLNIEQSTLHGSNLNSEETMIHSNGDGVTINIKESQVFGNTNTSTTEGASIVKVLNGTLNVDGSTFTNNQGNAWGGAIYVKNSDLSVTNSTFDANKITNTNSGGGGAIAAIDSNVTIENDTFTKNEGNVKGKGGAIYINNNGKDKTLSIDDKTKFEENSAQIGGAIYINGVKDATIGKATFSKNGFDGKNYDAQDAGAIYIESASGETNVTLNGTIFDQNNAYGPASSSGGAIYVRGNKTTFNVNGAKFTNNTSGLYGGALTVAHGARTYISDLDGDPTEFTGNMVQYATDHAGGGLFINQGYVHMDDVAIYNNYAKDGGGGISTCTKGSAEAKVLGGAAIFDNHVGSTFLDGVDSVVEDVDLKGNGNLFPHEEIESYPDIFFETKDHINRDTGEQLREWEIWPIELYERMFNGGVHKWNAKPFDGVKIHDTIALNSFMAKSNPTNKDISGARVIFTENVATSLGQTIWTATGGAIGCNGLLEMGTGTEIKIVKVWDDARNNDGYRPELDEKFLDNLIVKGNGEEIDIKADPIKTEILDIKDFDPAALANNIVNVQDSQKDYSDYDAWVVIISGLELIDGTGKPIQYTVEEKDPEYYSLISNIGDNDSYFEMKNRHNPDIVNIAVTKVWDDEDDKAGLRKPITIHLFADGEEVNQKELNAEGEWKTEFNELPRFKEGKEIEYTIEEDAINRYRVNIKMVTKVPVTKEAPLEADSEITVDQIVVDKEVRITNSLIPDTPDIPDTSDNSNISLNMMLFMISTLIASLSLLFKKKYS